MRAPADPGATVHSPHSHGSYRPDVDGLRAIAVLSVLAFHAFPTRLPGGFVGVDVFFVISGFLITGILLRDLERGRFSIADFYRRRVLRLFPALVLVLAATWGLGWATLLPADFAALGEHQGASAAFVANLYSWRHAGYFDTASELKPLLHLWSLGIEEQFYFVWPLLLYAAWRWPARAALLLVGTVAASFAASVWMLHVAGDLDAGYYLPQSRIWELGTGSLLAYARRPRASAARRTTAGTAIARWLGAPGARDTISVAGAALLGASLWLIDPQRAFPGVWALLPTLGATLILAAGPGALVNRVLLSHRIAVGIGLISYPLYLWHWPLLAVLRGVDDGEPPATLRVLAIVVAFGLAWLTYAYVETPLRTRATRATVPTLLAALGSVAAVGVLTTVHDGWPARFDPAIRAIVVLPHAPELAYREGACLLRPEQPAVELAPECADAPGAAPVVMLWGDSFAAHLYPGLATLEAAGARFGIAQVTAMGCPPVLGMDVPARPHCRSLNDLALQTVARLQPRTVVLAARWSMYRGGAWSRLDPRALRRTVDALAARGVREVVVFGEVPLWRRPLPAVLAHAYRSRGAVPERWRSGLDYEPVPVERALRSALAGSVARFVSARDLLCDRGGCRTLADAASRVPVAWDDGHLTRSGSVLLVKLAAPALLPSTRLSAVELP